jgi:hypothetical protein
MKRRVSPFIFLALFSPITMALTDHTIPPSLAFSFVMEQSVRTAGGKDGAVYMRL